MKNLAKVAVVRKKPAYRFSQRERPVTLAVAPASGWYGQPERGACRGYHDYFKSIYPDIEFTITRNQTELLDCCDLNLKTNLWLGFLFICIVAILFLEGVKAKGGNRTKCGSPVSSLVFPVLHLFQCNKPNIISLSD